MSEELQPDSEKIEVDGVPSNIQQEDAKGKGRKKRGILWVILGGLLTLFGAFWVIMGGMSVFLAQEFLQLGWETHSLAEIGIFFAAISIPYLLVGIPELVFGIRQARGGKKHHWIWDVATLVLFLNTLCLIVISFPGIIAGQQYLR